LVQHQKKPFCRTFLKKRILLQCNITVAKL
jgi:hypothetical protein